MQRRLLTLIAITALGAGLTACGSSSKTATPVASGSTTPGASTPASDTGQITIDSNFTFTTTPVKAGGTVTVKNTSNSQHTVTSDNTGGFDVTIDAGKTATFTAPAAGTWKFHCNIHTFMKGTLTVS